MTVTAEITRLEINLAKTLESIPQHAAALATSKADAQKLLDQYVACPVADTLVQLQTAHGAIAAAEAVQGAIGNPATWPDKVKSAWTTSNLRNLSFCLNGSLTSARHAAKPTGTPPQAS